MPDPPVPRQEKKNWVPNKSTFSAVVVNLVLLLFATLAPNPLRVLCLAGIFFVSVLWFHHTKLAKRRQKITTVFAVLFGALCVGTFFTLRFYDTNSAREAKPALVAIVNASVTRDDNNRRTIMEFAFRNLGDIETVGRVHTSVLVNGRDSEPDRPVPPQMTFLPDQTLVLSLGISNKSREGFDAIWSGRHTVEVRLRLHFTASFRERTYLYRGTLYPQGSVINTLQSDYLEGWTNDFQPEFPDDISKLIKSWGFVGDGLRLFAVVETDGLRLFAPRYVLLVAVLHDEDGMDALFDTRVQAGKPFEITGQRIRTEIPVSDAFKKRLNAATEAKINWYLCLLPRTAIESKISILEDVNRAGGHIVGYRSVATSAPTAP